MVRSWFHNGALQNYSILPLQLCFKISGTSPGEEFLAAGNAKALPVTYTYGFTDALEGMVAATYFMTPRGDYSPVSTLDLGVAYLISNNEPGQALSTGRLQKTGSNRFEIGATFRFK